MLLTDHHIDGSEYFQKEKPLNNKKYLDTIILRLTFALLLI